MAILFFLNFIFHDQEHCFSSVNFPHPGCNFSIHKNEFSALNLIDFISQILNSFSNCKVLHSSSEFLSPPPFVLWVTAVKWTAKWLSQFPPKQEIFFNLCALKCS